MTNIEGTVHPNAQTDMKVPPPKTPKGTRRKTPQTIKSEELMRRGIPKNHGMTLKLAWKLAKQIVIARRLGSAALNLTNAIFEFSNKNDWTGIRHPVVWPSNKLLAKKLGITVNAINKSMAKLVEAGILVHTHSYFIRRNGSRDDNGNIEFASGISLSPLITRCDEFYKEVEKFEAEKDSLDEAKKTRTNLIASVRSLISTGISFDSAGDWGHFRARLDAVRERNFAEIADLSDRIIELTQLRDECEKAIMDDDNIRETLTENEDAFLQSTDDREQDSPATSESVAELAATEEPPAKPSITEAWTLHTDMILTAAPFIKSLDPEITTWLEMKQNAKLFAAYAGIEPQIFGEAVHKLGIDLATATLILVAQRIADGKVVKSGPYMRSMIQKGSAGNLRLRESYYALANTKLAEMAFRSAQNTGFPAKGSIVWTRWKQITKDNQPLGAAHLHVDVFAKAFRKSAAKKAVDLTNPAIEADYIRFLNHWQTGNHKTVQ